MNTKFLMLKLAAFLTGFYALFTVVLIFVSFFNHVYLLALVGSFVGVVSWGIILRQDMKRFGFNLNSEIP